MSSKGEERKHRKNKHDRHEHKDKRKDDDNSHLGDEENHVDESRHEHKYTSSQ